MTRSNLLRAALVVAAPLLAAPAFGQSIGAPSYGSGVTYGARAWTDDGSAPAARPTAPTAPAYNSDPGFVWNGRSRFELAPAPRTPLASVPAPYTGPRNEP